MTQTTIDLKFDERCWRCEDNYPCCLTKDGVCTICKGEGYVTTDLGRELIEFIIRNLNKILGVGLPPIEKI